MRSISVVSAPAIEPLTVTAAKDFLRVTHSDDDDLIRNLIVHARETLEIRTQRSLITRTLKLTLDTFPPTRTIALPMSPLQSITSVQYIAPGATSLSTFSSDYYTADTVRLPGRLILKSDYSWPTTADDGNAVEITYVAGHGSAVSSLPMNLQQALLLYVSHGYLNRQIVSPVAMSKVPDSVSDIEFTYRIHMP